MTLFHLHINASNFEQSLNELRKQAKPNDGVLVLGHSVIYMADCISRIEQAQCSSSSEADEGVLLSWYVLATDVNAFADTAQTAFKKIIKLQDKTLTIIDNSAWLSLTLTADKVVMLA